MYWLKSRIDVPEANSPCRILILVAPPGSAGLVGPEFGSIPVRKLQTRLPHPTPLVVVWQGAGIRPAASF
jgi:hypothetical protein